MSRVQSSSARPGTDASLTQLIKDGDSPYVVMFPEGVALAALAESLVALANTPHGGTVILGAQDDAVQGLSDAEAALDLALQALLSVAPRLIVPMPQTVTLEAHTLITLTIPAGLPQVYAYEGRYFVRDGDSNQPLDPPALRRLLLARGEISFETELPLDADRDALDWAQVSAYARRMGAVSDPEALLVRRGCAVLRDGTLRPTHAGVLLFGRDVGRWLRGSEITAVRFPGTQMSDHFTRQDIGGTLPEQIRQAETFLRDHLRKGVQLSDSMARSERYEVPLEAARELVVNAVAHRDYSISGDGIRLYLFKDRLEITSPGRLPGPVTVANIRDERFSRNPAIVQVLADMGFIERLGYGVDRVLDLMRQQDLRPPEFHETGGGFRAMLYNTPLSEADDRPTDPAAPTARTAAPVQPTQPAPQAEPPAEPSIPVLDDAARQAVLAQYPDIALNPRQETALAYLHDAGRTRITNSELQQLHPDVHPETIRRDLSALVSKGLLHKMGVKRGSYYVLRKDDERDENSSSDQSSDG